MRFANSLVGHVRGGLGMSNVVGCTLFGGIAGSALATLVANVVACGALIAYIAIRNLPLKLGRAEWRYVLPDPGLAQTIVGKGLPIGAQMLVISGAGLAMVGLVNRNGVDTTAAYGITQQDDPLSQALHQLIEHAAQQERQIEQLRAALEKIAPEVCADLAQEADHLPVDQLNKMV